MERQPLNRLMNQMKYIFFPFLFILTLISCSNNENAFKEMADSTHISKLPKQVNSMPSKQNTFFIEAGKKLLITENMLDIDLIYQKALNKQKHVSKVESLVKKLLKCGIRDSLIIVDYIDKLAATQTADAYCFLFMSCCQFYNIKHVTPFQSKVEILRKYGRPYVAINKYYLNNSIPINLSSEEFANQVISKCYKNLPECYYINH